MTAQYDWAPVVDVLRRNIENVLYAAAKHTCNIYKKKKKKKTTTTTTIIVIIILITTIILILKLEEK